MSSWNNLKNSIFLNKKNIIVFPLLVAFFLYYPFIKHGWWTGDDAYILDLTITHGWLSFFINPDIWHKMSFTNLTPWINLSYAVDYYLFGLNPFGFYLHHFISFAVVLICCGLLLFEITNTKTTIGTLLLFLSSLPAMATMRYLWFRHYLEGLGFAALSLFFFISGVKNKNIKQTLIGTFFYLLACTAKEIYVPLVAIILTYPPVCSRQHIKHKTPFGLVALFYVFWRTKMLGTNNIYTVYFDASNSLNTLAKTVPLILKGIFFYEALAYTYIILFFLLFIYFIKTSKPNIKMVFFVLLMALLIPIFPVVNSLVFINKDLFLSLRFLILVTIVFYFFITLHAFNIALKLGYIILTLTLVVNLFLLNKTRAIESGLHLFKKNKTVCNFVFNATEEEILVYSDPTINFFPKLFTLYKKLKLIQPKQKNRLCTDGCLCKLLQKNQKIKYYQFNKNKLVLTQIENCNIEQNTKPEGSFIYNKGLLKWSLGPFDSGQYCALPLQDGLPSSIVYLPKKGKIKFYLDKDIQLVLRYTSPAGWTAYSNIIEVKVDAGKN